jgi:hypothetical protein
VRAVVVNQNASVPAGGSQRTASPTTCAKRLKCARWLQTACGRRVEFNAKAPRRQAGKKTRPGGWPLRPTADCGHSSDTFWFNFFASSRLCAFASKVGGRRLSSAANDSPDRAGGGQRLRSRDLSRRNQMKAEGCGKARQGWHICSLTILKATKLRSGAVYSPMPLLRSLGFWRAGFYKDVAPLALGKAGRVNPCASTT